MKSELFVVTLIKASSKSRYACSALLDGSFALKWVSVMAKLGQPATLTRLAQRFECASSQVFTKLSTYILTKCSPGLEEEGILLDSLGIVYFQERIKWIVQQIRDECQRSLNEMEKLIPVSSSLGRLFFAIQFYELRAPALAWNRTLNFKEAETPTLQEFLTRIGLKEIMITGKSAAPKPNTMLKVRSQPNKGRLIVACEIEKVSQPLDILVIDQIPASIFPKLEHFFTSVPVSVFSANSTPADLGKLLLQTRFFALTSLQAALLTACYQLRTKILQALILSGQALPGQLDPLWKQYLSYYKAIISEQDYRWLHLEVGLRSMECKAPFTAVDPSQDVIFLKGQADILKLVEQNYRGQPNLRIIE